MPSQLDTKMEQLLTKFGLPIEKLYTLLKGTNTIMAGSAPLSVLLNGAFEPNDIDIWIDNDTYELSDYIIESYRKWRPYIKIDTDYYHEIIKVSRS